MCIRKELKKLNKCFSLWSNTLTLEQETVEKYYPSLFEKMKKERRFYLSLEDEDVDFTYQKGYKRFYFGRNVKPKEPSKVKHADEVRGIKVEGFVPDFNYYNDGVKLSEEQIEILKSIEIEKPEGPITGGSGSYAHALKVTKEIADKHFLKWIAR